MICAFDPFFYLCLRYECLFGLWANILIGRLMFIVTDARPQPDSNAS